MIRWCAYCQTYQGESAPFDDYRITHTICPSCFERAARREDLEAGLEPIRDFFARLSTQPRDASPARLISEGEELGLAPMDLLVGVLQPVLYEVGDRWARSEASIADEHAISHACSAAVELLLARRPELAANRQVRSPDVLLACAPENMHCIGLQLVEFFLLTEGLTTYTVVPGLPADEIVELTRRLAPRALGISAATPEQMQHACAIARSVGALPGPHHPKVVLGGFAARERPTLPPGTPALLCRDFREMREVLAGGDAKA